MLTPSASSLPTPPLPSSLQNGAHHEKCEAVVLSALKHQAECGAPQLQCTFNGAWGGPRVPKVFYVSSYFWDRATDSGQQGGGGVTCFSSG